MLCPHISDAKSQHKNMRLEQLKLFPRPWTISLRIFTLKCQHSKSLDVRNTNLKCKSTPGDSCLHWAARDKLCNLNQIYPLYYTFDNYSGKFCCHHYHQCHRCSANKQISHSIDQSTHICIAPNAVNKSENGKMLCRCSVLMFCYLWQVNI